MNALTLSQQDAPSGAKTSVTSRRPLEEAQIWGAIIGLCGGVTVAVLGSLLTAAGWIAADAGAKHWLSTAGTVLLCLTIPLIVLAAFCLDGLEKGKTQDLLQVARDDEEDDES